ncbi:hypothetical protein Tco_0634843 [Tanacetum coccineum]
MDVIKPCLLRQICCLPTLPFTTTPEPKRVLLGADDEEIPEGGIPRVIVLGYDGLPIQPVAPPSPDYIPWVTQMNPQTPPVPQDEDEREPIYVTESDPEEDPEEY